MRFISALRFLAAMVAVCVVTGGFMSCDVSGPDRVIRPPVVKGFEPTRPSLNVVVGDTLRFSIRAVDPGDLDLKFCFTLGDSIVSNQQDWTYVVHDTGSVDVLGQVSNEGASTEIRWRLERTEPENVPPVIVEYQPLDFNPTVTVGDVIEFFIVARDPEGQPLTFVFTLDDSIVSVSNRYFLQSDEIGPVRVRAIVTDGEAIATHDWNLTVLAEPDSILPATVNLRSIAKGSQPGELVVEWMAVGDDGMEGLPSEYVIMTASSPIVDEFAWASASERTPTPPPAPAGTIHQMVVHGLRPARLVYVAVRARDDFGNLSPLGNSLGLETKGIDVYGVVLDAVTGDPVEGLHLSHLNRFSTSGVDGSFALIDLPDGSGPFRIWDEDDAGVVGAYFDISTESQTPVHGSHSTYWVLPNMPMETTYYSDFLEFMKKMNDIGQTYENILRTWDAPVDVYIPPYTHNGLEFHQIVEDAFLNWEELTGFDLFNFVDTIPDLGVYVAYDGSIDRDKYSRLKVDPETLTLLGRITFRTFYDSDSEWLFQRIARHEVGHALGLGHSEDPWHLMIGFQAQRVDQATVDEIALARAMYRLGRGASIDIHLRD